MWNWISTLHIGTFRIPWRLPRHCLSLCKEKGGRALPKQGLAHQGNQRMEQPLVREKWESWCQRLSFLRNFGLMRERAMLGFRKKVSIQGKVAGSRLEGEPSSAHRQSFRDVRPVELERIRSTACLVPAQPLTAWKACYIFNKKDILCAQASPSPALSISTFSLGHLAFCLRTALNLFETSSPRA